MKMKDSFDRLISSMDIAEKRELEDTSVEMPTTEM